MKLQACGLGCSRGESQLFTDVGFELGGGEAIRISGRNGSGKTSLLRILCGLAPPVDGEVRWGGKNIRRVREEYNARLVYLGHAGGLKEDLLAWENLAMASALGGERIGMEEACDALAGVGLAHAAELPARVLSQGQRKRVALARLTLGLARPLWILDEPFTALDADAVGALCATIDRHLAGGGMLVYTTHQEVRLKASRNLVLELGGEASC